MLIKILLTNVFCSFASHIIFQLSDIPENLLPEGFELPINSEGFFDLKRSADASESGSNPKMDMLTALATRVMKKQSQELEPVIPQYIFLRYDKQ